MMATKRKQIVGYVEPSVWTRIHRINQQNRFLTVSVMVDMAMSRFLPELERSVAKGMLPQPVSPRTARG